MRSTFLDSRLRSRHLAPLAVPMLALFVASAHAQAPGRSTVLVSDTTHPAFLMLDSAYVYWVDEGSGIVRVPKRGGASTVVAPVVPMSIVLAGGWLYYRDDAEQELRRVRTDGGAPHTIAPESDGQGPIVVDSGYVYWTHDEPDRPTQLLRAPIVGGSPAVVHTFPSFAYDFVIDGAYLAFADRAGLHVASLGGPARRLDARCDGNYGALALAHGHLYWQCGPELWRATIAGGQIERVARGVDAFAVTADAAYWTSDWRLLRWTNGERGAHERGRIAHTPHLLELPTTLAVDSSGAYWMSRGSAEPDPPCPQDADPHTGRIGRVPR